jgi:hypothetical protein
LEGTTEGFHNHPCKGVEQLVAEAGDGILLMQHQGPALHPGGHATRAGHKTSHTQHAVGLDLLHESPGLQQRAADGKGRRQQLADALAAQAANRDEVQRNVGLADDTRFQPGAGTEPLHLDATRL